MDAREGITLTDAQRERLLQCRADWNEGEGEEALERMRQTEEDAETLRAIATLLAETRFTQGKSLSFAALGRLLTLARALAPNPNLDARILRQSDERDALNTDLHDLLFGESPIAARLRAFLKRRHAGHQTAFQLLCAVFPEQWPLLAPQGMRLLEPDPEQRALALRKARKRFALSEESVPDTDRILRALAEVPLYEAVKDTLGAENFVEVYRLLMYGVAGKTRRRRKAYYYMPLAPAGLAVARVEEDQSNRYAPTLPGGVGSADLLPEIPELPAESGLLTVQMLEREIVAQGFTYPPLTIRSVYLSLQTRPFLLLAGLPGSGKSRLPGLFASALTGEIGAQYLLLSVRPDWTNSTPLFGTGAFTPPFLEWMRFAERPENAHRAFFVCLDEMNLARIEHYGAELLSLMEAPDRSLVLPDGKIARWPANLFLIGTLNRDEVAFPLSRKVLDRANVLLFSEVCLHAAELPESLPAAMLSHAQRQAAFLLGRLRDGRAVRARLQRFGEDLAMPILQTLSEANALLEPFGLHFGYRVRDEVLRFCALSCGAEGETLLAAGDAKANLRLALDLQLQQRVLPRFSGSQETLESPLRALLHYTERHGFTQTARRLSRLLARLQRAGFVRFDDV
jgi:energy-coupling factor transporter ATP-binding protein EcfA2